jgi:hypothetical protein
MLSRSRAGFGACLRRDSIAGIDVVDPAGAGVFVDPRIFKRWGIVYSLGIIPHSQNVRFRCSSSRRKRGRRKMDIVSTRLPEGVGSLIQTTCLCLQFAEQLPTF